MIHFIGRVILMKKKTSKPLYMNIGVIALLISGSIETKFKMIAKDSIIKSKRDIQQ